MASVIPKSTEQERLPTHLDLPATDGSIVQNFRELPQNVLLTTSILPLLRLKHPDQYFAIGHDSGIYWRITDPPLRGCKAPDWFYVPGVPPLLEGRYRRSYVLWQELVPPAVILEYLSDDGTGERDRTPLEGKFWVYEQAIRAEYYGIFDVESGHLEVYRLIEGRYQPLAPNERGHFPIPPLGVSLGVWNGFFFNEVAPWLRWFDDRGVLVPSDADRAAVEREIAEAATQRAERGEEIAEAERQRAELQQERAEAERQRAELQQERAEAERQRAELQQERAERLAARLRELGADPDEV